MDAAHQSTGQPYLPTRWEEAIIAERFLYIREPRQRPEPQFFVPIQRCLVAHTAIDDIRIIVMREAERVELDLIHAATVVKATARLDSVGRASLRHPELRAAISR